MTIDVDEARAMLRDMIEDVQTLHRKLLIIDELLLRDRRDRDAQLSSLRRPHDSRQDEDRRDGDPRHSRPSLDRVEALAREYPPGGPAAIGGVASVTELRRPGDDRARRDLPPAAAHLRDARGDLARGARVKIVEGQYTGEVGQLVDFEESGFGRIYVTIKGPGGTFRALVGNVEVQPFG